MTNLPYENLKCPECSGDMIARNGKFGKFWGCKAYPECKGTRDNQGRSKQDRQEEKDRSYDIDKGDKETLNSLMRDVSNKGYAFTFNKDKKL